MNIFSERLKKLRISQKITQEILSEAIGIQAGSISRYEAGSNLPKTEIICKLANYFNVSVEFLLGCGKTEYSKRFGEILEKLMIENGLKVEKLAYYLNISEYLLSCYKTGLLEPNLDFIKKVCKFFNVSADFLLEFSNISERVEDIHDLKVIQKAKIFDQIIEVLNFNSGEIYKFSLIEVSETSKQKTEEV